MKIAFLFFILISESTYASTEHTEKRIHKASQSQISFYRSCFSEMDKLGCGHPRSDVHSFKECLYDKQNDLSINCRAFFTKLYGNGSKTL
jgi:hypothetical protein